ncbi:MAG: NHL repeat-containing protein [Ignavibacteriae bacterium]|nr:NHL repeat-containing protein [Ignavibacteriota bacterium]
MHFTVAADTLLSEEYVFGSFREAHRVLLTAQGSIIVADAGEHSISLFTSPRQKPKTVGGYGWGATSFDMPTGIATDGITLYVSDYHNHRIQRFDRNLTYLSTFFTRDTNVVAARFGYPSGVALSRLGDLFVLDSENARVLKFNRSLLFERSFGGIETERGKLKNPSKMIVTTDDRVFVLDADRLLEFDYFGNYVRSIGDGVLRNARGFDANKGGIVVVSDSAIVWFQQDGRFVRSHSISEILASVLLAPLQDVAFSGDTLYLLTPRKVVVLKVITRP